MDAITTGRQRLAAWHDQRPANFYQASPLLARVVKRLAEGRVDLQRMARFGGACATTIDTAACENDRPGNHPRIERFDGIGRRTEQIVFHPAYHEAGRPAYDAGLVACLAEPGHVVEQSGLFYLLSHCGEMGHSCPITCTSGLVRALQHKGSDQLKRRWLPSLLTADYDRKAHGSQFLTEVQGGSDVGAIAVAARPDPAQPGAWRLTGEKWFCSVADANLYLVVARPEGAAGGTRGLGCFLVPRHLDDGTPNGFALRRLKDKIGTRTMASAEIDFDAALGWPIGALDEGFKIAVGIVLNTSRLMNALGSTGAMHRAYLDARRFAEARDAFGAPIVQYPLVRETLAQMKADEAGALLSTLHLASLVDKIDMGTASEDEDRLHRLIVNANKYWTSITGSRLARQGIEILGGNGTIETFSILPRLYRDSIVLESWEGAHNVLCMQVLRDAAKLDLFSAFDRALAALLKTAGRADAALAGRIGAAWKTLQPELDRCVRDPLGHGALHTRRGLERLMCVWQTALLLEQAALDQASDRAELLAMAQFQTCRYLDPAYRPEADAGYGRQIDAVLGTTK